MSCVLYITKNRSSKRFPCGSGGGGAMAEELVFVESSFCHMDVSTDSLFLDSVGVCSTENVRQIRFAANSSGHTLSADVSLEICGGREVSTLL